MYRRTVKLAIWRAKPGSNRCTEQLAIRCAEQLAIGIAYYLTFLETDRSANGSTNEGTNDRTQRGSKWLVLPQYVTDRISFRKHVPKFFSHERPNTAANSCTNEASNSSSNSWTDRITHSLTNIFTDQVTDRQAQFRSKWLVLSE